MTGRVITDITVTIVTTGTEPGLNRDSTEIELGLNLPQRRRVQAKHQ
jgi:hypothetical protein